MYSYNAFYDHYVVTKDGEIMYHVDTEAEAKHEIEILENNSELEEKQIQSDKNYVVYHCHTEQSLLDSCTNYKLYVDKCVQLGQKAIAFTEHG